MYFDICRNYTLWWNLKRSSVEKWARTMTCPRVVAKRPIAEVAATSRASNIQNRPADCRAEWARRPDDIRQGWLARRRVEAAGIGLNLPNLSSGFDVIVFYRARNRFEWQVQDGKHEIIASGFTLSVAGARSEGRLEADRLSQKRHAIEE
jgi:hypothetical protein